MLNKYIIPVQSDLDNTKFIMGIRIGNFDPIQLSFSIVNQLMAKGLLSVEDAKTIIKNALPKDMTDEKKEEIVKSLIVENGNG